MRKLAALAAVLAAVSACSDDGGGGAGSQSGSGGQAALPTGAVNMEVYATMQQTCPPGNVHIDIGNVRTSPPETVVQGRDGAQVSCSVVPSGGQLDASGAIADGALSFSFGGVLTDGGSAVGEVTFLDPADGVAYTSSAAAPCVFQFAPGSDQGIAPGRINVQFDCSNLVSEADPTAACSSRYGYLLLENCEGGTP